MGIELLWNILKNNNILNSNGSIINKKKKIKCNHLYIDFSSLIYASIAIIDKEIEILIRDIKTFKNENNNVNIDKIKKEFKNSPFLFLLNSTNRENINTYIENINKFNINNISHLNNLIVDKIKILILNIINDVNSIELKNIVIAMDGIPTMSKIVEQKHRRYLKFLNNIDSIYPQINVKSELLNIIFNSLNTDEYKNTIKNTILNTNKEQINLTILSHNELGEGEKKITTHIINNLQNKTDTIVIYGPDSDMIILSLILNVCHNFNSIYIVGNEIIIYCQIIINNIITYLGQHSYLTNYISNPIINNNIIMDICTIMTLFGNDHLPKMETFDIQVNFNLILNIYQTFLIQQLQYYQNNYLEGYQNYKYFIVDYINNKYVINFHCLHIFFFFVQKETHVIYYNALTNNNIIIFANKILNIINNYIKLNENIENIENATDIIYNNMTQIYSLNKFSKLYEQIVNTDSNNNLNYNIKNYIYQMLSNPNVIHDIYYNIYFGKIFIEYNDFKYNFHNYNNFDENYIINTYKEDKIIYYKYLFNITSNFELLRKKNLIINEYLIGFNWVFNFYFNELITNNTVLTWNYPYNYTPLIDDIYDNLNDLFQTNNEVNNKYNNFISKINNISYVNKENFLNKHEVYLYITPQILFNNSDKNYLNNNINNNIFPIISNNNLECTHIKYNDCKLNIPNVSFDDYMIFIKPLRKN